MANGRMRGRFVGWEESVCKGPVLERTWNIQGDETNLVYLEQEDQDGMGACLDRLVGSEIYFDILF